LDVKRRYIVRFASNVLRGLGIGTVSLVLVAGSGGVADAAGTGAYLLTAAAPDATYSPTFTGNGLLGVRVPPVGQGYAPGTVPAQSELAGFYAQPAGGVQQRANIPTWSTLAFSDGGEPFSLSSGSTSDWRQSLDLRTGVVTTSARWTAPDGHLTELTYRLLTDRARPDIGLVTLQLTPSWSGLATVTDTIDGTPATLSSQVSKGWVSDSQRDWVEVQAQGTGIDLAVASQLRTSPNIDATTTDVGQSTDQSVGQELSFPVTAGQTYTVTKYVAVESSQSAFDPTATAQANAGSAARAGLAALRRANDAAWAALWNGRIDVIDNPSLATEVNASEFYLWSSTRAGVDWSISPAGLSSNGYNGHVFWDAETWMYPALLAEHPDLAAGINAYRFDRLSAADLHAAETGYQGARFPWESALDGTEQIPPPASINSEGLFEQHITADIALAQWQYYLATGSKRWLSTQGWPVISAAAAFWASRVTLGSDGQFHVLGVTGPDEENPDVNDEAYTNAAARTTLRDAVQAARALGMNAPASWSQIASRIVVPATTRPAIQPEFQGYGGQLVKQADVSLLQYPWAFPMSSRVARNDLDYYTQRTDPDGPSMTDAIGSIDTSALGTAGCAAYVYTQRSVEPFIRDAFDQFSETRNGGAFTFMTGIGGFLQEFIYGYSGLRWNAHAVQLAPSLSAQIGALVLNGLTWRGRHFTISIGPRRTTIRLNRGAAMPVIVRGRKRTVRAGHSLTVATRRPDLIRTGDLVRCGDATASTAQPGAPPLAAVDGSGATDWQPASLPATLTAPVRGGPRRVRTASLRWGEQFPPAPGPNVPPPPGPVTTLRASGYTVQVSANGHAWRTVAAVSGRTTGTVDVVQFAATRARFVRVQITASATSQAPVLDELTVG
jgi:trehalose/maltose hydrolase-like predicted phosphorylase